MLQQLHGNEWRPVAYASKSMTDCQTRYAPIERESLAVEFACGRFHQYIFGQTVEVESDSKPLVAIFSKALNECRIQWIRLNPMDKTEVAEVRPETCICTRKVHVHCRYIITPESEREQSL